MSSVMWLKSEGIELYVWWFFFFLIFSFSTHKMCSDIKNQSILLLRLLHFEHQATRGATLVPERPVRCPMPAQRRCGAGPLLPVRPQGGLCRPPGSRSPTGRPLQAPWSPFAHRAASAGLRSETPLPSSAIEIQTRWEVCALWKSYHGSLCQHNKHSQTVKRNAVRPLFYAR